MCKAFKIPFTGLLKVFKKLFKGLLKVSNWILLQLQHKDASIDWDSKVAQQVKTVKEAKEQGSQKSKETFKGFLKFLYQSLEAF